MGYTILTETEMNVLKLLWNSERALTRSEIFDRLPNKKGHTNAINQVLNTMMEKGVVRVDGLTRCGRIYGRTYAPAMTMEEFLVQQAEGVMSECTADARFLRIASAWAEGGKISRKAILELNNQLQTYLQKLEQESKLEELMEAHKRELNLE